MKERNSSPTITGFDERRDIALPGNAHDTIEFALHHLLNAARSSIEEKGFFSLALSGGSTPKALFSRLSGEKKWRDIDWSKVLLFWSDERCVPPDHPDSNYHMAMESGLSHLPIPIENIHRMKGEEEPEKQAKEYENLLENILGDNPLDYVMLGMGEDGHTASLFPETHALHAVKRKIVANYIPKMECWRLTMTFDTINSAKISAIYVLGENKADTVRKIFTSPYTPDILPIQRVGTAKNRALWILDDAAAKEIVKEV